MSRARKTTIVTAALAGSFFGRKAMRNEAVRNRLHELVDGIRGAIMPTHVDRFLPPLEPDAAAHAPGHRHLDRSDRSSGPSPVRPDGRPGPLPDYPGGHR